jgi:hypothetical protein
MTWTVVHVNRSRRIFLAEPVRRPAERRLPGAVEASVIDQFT